MKTKVLLISLILLGSLTGAYAQSDLFDKLSNERNITVVTITKTLLSMMPDMATEQMDIEGIQVAHLISKLDQLDIFTSEDSSVKKMMRDGVKSTILNNKTYENIMKVKDEGSEIGFFIEKGESNLIRSLIMFVDDDDECVLLRMLGNFTLEDIQKVTANSNQ